MVSIAVIQSVGLVINQNMTNPIRRYSREFEVQTFGCEKFKKFIPHTALI